MRPSFAFSKMHGLGNDFIVVDRRSNAPADGPMDWFEDAAAIAALCDRRFGIGADGVLLIGPPSPEAAAHGAIARMRIRNADGSEAEMCGNGLRCVASYLGLDGEMLIETGAGVLACSLHADRQIQIAMGAPRWNLVQHPFAIRDTIWSLTTVSMGNPHAIVFCENISDLGALRVLAERYGPLFEHHSLFTNKTNVEFVQAMDRDYFRTVVWERGCGITLACGTGACAAAVAACLTGRAEPDSWLTIELLGGLLKVRVEPSYSQVHLRGPAVTVYRGQLS